MRRLLAAVVVLGCAGGLGAQSIQWEARKVERLLPGCGDDQNGCAHVRLNFLAFTGGAPPEALDRMNRAVMAYVLERPADNLTLTPDEYADEFITNYTMADHTIGPKWFLQKTIEVLRTAPPAISLECEASSFLGGAHPNSSTTFLNFLAATGTPLKLSDIVRDGAMPQLTAIAEVYFRRKRKLAEGADLKKEGFVFFKDDRFALNGNFGITPDGLRFVFNAYEVAPYAWGATEFDVPFSAIGELLRPESEW